MGIISLLLWGFAAEAQFAIGNWRLPNGSLSISDGPTYSYGTVSLSSTTDKAFTVSSDRGRVFNLAGTTFSQPAYTYKGGTYPGTGGDCTDYLQPLASCTLVVTASSATGGTFSSSILLNYNTGSGTSSISRAITGVFSNTTTELAWKNPAAFVKVNECREFILERRDSGGNAVALAGVTVGTLVINQLTTSGFYVDSSCASVRTVGTIASGSTGVSVWLRSTTGNQSGILVASNTGVTAASHNVTITTVPTRLDLIAAPNLKTNTCNSVTVESVDANGFISSVGAPVNANLTTNGANLFYADSGCATTITTATLAVSTSSKSVYTLGTLVQSGRTLTATDAAGTLTVANKTVNFVSALTWWDTNYLRRIRIDVDNLDQAVAFTNQPVLVTLNSSVIDYSDFLGAGADVRFVADDDSTQLPHEIEQWSIIGTSQMWVRVPTITASSSSNFIYMYYKNPGASDGQNRTPIWTGHYAVWHLGEDPTGSAPQYIDATGGGKNGTATNSPGRAAGIVGNGANLLGTTDYILINTDLTLVAGGTSTVSFWMRTAQTGSANPWTAPGIMGVDMGATNDIFYGWLDAAGNIGVQAGNGTPAKSAYVVNNNAWRHVTITRHTNGTAAFYINGVQTATATSDTGYKTTTFNQLGQMMVPACNFNGYLDEVRMTQGLRSAAQIRADFKYMMNTHLYYNAPETQ